MGKAENKGLEAKYTKQLGLPIAKEWDATCILHMRKSKEHGYLGKTQVDLM